MAVSRKFLTVGAVSVAAFALIGAGASATFTDSATANANINTGTFSCELSSTDTHVAISADKHTATVDLGTINSSAASSKTAPVTVTNTGTIALATTWSETTTGNLGGAISAIPAAGGVQLGAGTAQTVSIGFSWPELVNDDLGRSGTAVYTVSCNDVATNQPGFRLFQQVGGLASWDSGHAVLNIPTGVDPNTAVAAGIEILGVSTGLPINAPEFVTDVYGAGTPRLVIGFSDGTRAFGYPSFQAGINNWDVPTGGWADSWADVQAYAAGKTVVKAYIVADGSNGAGKVSNVSCVNYSGTPLFGTGC